MRKLRAVAAAVAAGLILGGCSTPAGHAPPSPPPLTSETGSRFSYTLDDVRSCEVGDALAIAINQAREPLRVTGTAMTVTGHGADQRSYQIATVRPGFAGEVAAGSRLVTLAGYHLAPAPGTLLLPVSAGGQGYVFVAWLRILGEHTRPWAITGLTVRYELGQKAYTTFFPQDIKLPPVSCPRQ